MTPRRRPASRRAGRPGTAWAPGSEPAAGSRPPGPARRTWAREFLRSPALWSALAALLLYAPTLGYGFVWDDHSLIENNPLLRASPPPPRLITGDFWAGTGGATGYWRPLILLSYWLDLRIAPVSPVWFHAMNAIAHAFASALVGLLLTQSGAGALAALLGGMWFAAHPVHVESVAFVAGRTDVYCAVFVLLAIWLDRRARRAGRAGPGAGAVAALVLALLAKEAAVLAVGVLALVEWCERPRAEFSWRRALRWLAPYAAATLVYLALHAALAGFGRPSADPAAPALRWAAWKAFVRYLALLLPGWPHPPGEGLELPRGALAPEVALGILGQAAVIGLLGWWSARRKPAAVPLALFWMPLVPLTLISTVNGQLLFAGRFLYLPSSGAAWLLGLGLAGLAAPKPRDRPAGAGAPAWLGLGLGATMVLAAAAGTVATLPAWSDDEPLFRAMVAGTPQGPEGRMQLASVLLRKGRVAEAETEIRVARALRPGFPGVDLVDAALQSQRGRWPEVLDLALRVLARDPANPQGRLVRATALLKLERLEEAGAALDSLRRDVPGLATVEVVWGEWLVIRGRAAEAIPVLEDATARVRDADACYALGMARAQLRRMPEAKDAFARAVAIDPSHYEAWLRLAVASHLSGDTAGRNAAFARAAALPEARDGRAALLRRQFAPGP